MKKILVIDDQKDNLITIKAVINNNLPNCKALSATSGKEGIEIAKSEQPDVIILDIIMPIMDGFEVCSKLKADELTKHIPIIMVTAIKTDSKSRVKGLNIGAEAFISKPIDVSEFTAQVNVMLRIKEAEDMLRIENKLLDHRIEQKSKKLIESYDKYHSLFANMMNGFALHEIVLDKKGKPVDYIFLEINDTFIIQTGLKKEDIIGKRVTEALPGIENDPSDWIGRYGKVALGGGEIRFEQYSEQLDKWYSVLAYSTSKGTFATVFNDITKQKKTEEQIRTEQQFIDTALNAQDDTFFLFEVATGKALKWNDAFRKISGYTDQEIEMMPAPQTYYSAEDLERAASFIQGLPKEGADTIELDLICKDGGKIPTEYRASFLMDELKEPKYIISVGRDITERKKAEGKLKEQAVFVEQNPAPVFSVNYLGEILVVNIATQRISKDVKPGKLIYEIFENINLSSLTKLKDTENIQIEEILNSKFYLFTIKKSSETQSIYFFGMDITDRKQTEKDLQYNIENQQNLLEISKSLTSTLDIKTVFQNITDSSIRLASMDTAAIYITKKGELYVGATSPPLPQDFPEEFKRALLVNHPNIQKAVSTGKTHIVHDLDTANLTPEEKMIKESSNMRTIVYIPLIVKRQALGVLILATTNETRLISKSEIDLYKAFAPQAALAIDNSRLYEKTKKSVVEMKQRILERKQAEAAFKESEERLELFFSQSLDGFFFMMLDEPIEWNEDTDKDKVMDYVFAHQRITKANDAILEQYEATREQYIGLTPNDMFAHDLNEGRKIWREFFDAGKLRVETDEKKLDGTSMLIEGDYTCMYDSKKRIIGHFGIQRDITDRKIAEDALQDSEQKYKDLFEKSDDAVLIISDNQFIDCNMATVKMLRYKNKKELLDTHPSELSPEKQPDGRLSYEKAEEMMNIALKQGSHRFEWDHKKSDGEVFPVEVLLTSITRSAGKRIIHTVWRDITNRRRTNLIQKTLYNISNTSIKSDNIETLINIIQKELSTIIDTTNFYVALYDPDTDTISLLFMADEKDKFTKFPAGKTLTYYVIKTQKPLLATKEKIKELENLGEVESFGSDSEIWLGVPLKVDGKVTGVLAVQSYTDEAAYNVSDMELLEFVSDQISISIDRKKAEEDIKEALHKATESDRLKSTFLATMSHELRTPLNAIIGFSSLVNESTTFSDVLKFTKTINSSGNHLLNIVEDLFDITLIESGETKLKKTKVRLNDILIEIHEISKAEKNNLNKNNLELNLVTDTTEQDIIINTDPSKLKQILINLLKNSLKFTHKGHVNFGYKVIEDDNNKHLEFFVKDTGIGIPKEKQKLIFDVFARLEDPHSGTYGGTGIGLSIAKKLTELLGGKIWVVSEQNDQNMGDGSEFYFTLPYDEPKPEAETKVKVEHKVDTVITHVSSAEKILVVEDDQFSYEFLKIILERSETSILRALDGEEAIKLCEENPDIDLVLMDINMPVMNGFEATKRIKKFRPQLPIIAQTAYAISGDREKALAAGCVDYISKPIKKDELLQKIEKLLSS